MPEVSEPRRVFLSYRSVDKARVETVAVALRKAGVDAWFDDWEILAGDNFVAKINNGLDRCHCGIVFLSNESLAGAWHQDEITILKDLAVSEKRPLIPVLLDVNVKVPPILRVYSRLLADDIPALVRAINGRTAKPGLGVASSAAACLRFSIHLRELGQAVGVSAQVDGKEIVPEISAVPGAAFRFSYSDFLKGTPSSRMGNPREQAVLRQEELHKLGDAVGQVVFAGEIGYKLSSHVDEAARRNAEIELTFEATNGKLLCIPFEAARLADGRVPALLPGVFTTRRPAWAIAVNPSSLAPPPGPLKVLVAVGAPDEGKTQSAVLDSEKELQTILDSLDKARNLGNAYVRVLEVGSPEQIGAALRETGYHVLHLSGHGNKGVLELEDEDGNPVRVTAERLAEKIHESGHRAPLVFLASCHSGLADDITASFAQGLLDHGIPAVLAMQTAVSDDYATALAGKFYEDLAQSEPPLASRSLTLARRRVEEERRQAGAQPGVSDVPEYATPSLFLRGEEEAILDHALPQAAPKEPPKPGASGGVPLLNIGDLIGRRSEMRRMVRVLTDDKKTVAANGRRAGCQILGTGGVGKSSVAGRVMQRMSDRGWRIAAVSGAWNLSRISNALSSALWGHSNSQLAALARSLADPQASDNVRLEWVREILTHQEVLLVLDNFEDVLTPAGQAFRDSVTAEICAFLLRAANRGKLLITSRYPVPGAEDYFLRIDLGPLSRAETRKLMLRHEGLKGQSGDAAKLIERAIGGHPRTLEYLDALLRNGNARIDTIRDRLRKFAAKTGVSLAGDFAFEERVRDAIRIAAADALVDELVRVVGQVPGDLALLWQVSVYPFPIPFEALPDATSAAIQRLTASSLLTVLDGDHLFVHRWTAEALRLHIEKEEYRTCCLRGAEYLLARPSADQGQWVTDFTECIRLFLSGGDYDKASRGRGQLFHFLQSYSQVTAWTELAREVGTALPDGYPDKLRFIGEEADGLYSLGFSGEALEKYLAVTATAERLVQQEPGRADYLRDLSVSYNKMGDLQRALGQGDEARLFFEKSLTIAERLVQQEPGRADYLRDLSVLYNKMGDLQSALGQGDEARLFFEKSLTIAERLVQQEPGRADYLRDLSVSYSKMGDLQSALGQGDEARLFFEKSLTIAERLVQQEPGRADYLRDLSVSYNKMGDLQSALGQGDEARLFFEKSLTIAERLVQQEPGRADYLRDLSVSYERLGDLQSALGQGDDARLFFEKSLTIRERLVQQEPGRADYLRDLSVSYERLGDLQRALGQGDEARLFFEKSLTIAERLVQQEPGRADYLRDLSVSYERLGDLQRALGQGDEARLFFEKSLTIAERLVQQEPGRADYLRDLSVSYERLGDLQRALGQGDEARLFFEKSLAIRERLVQQEPGRADYRLDLAKSLARVGSQQSLDRAFRILTAMQEAHQLEFEVTQVTEVIESLLRGL